MRENKKIKEREGRERVLINEQLGLKEMREKKKGKGKGKGKSIEDSRRSGDSYRNRRREGWMAGLELTSIICRTRIHPETRLREICTR